MADGQLTIARHHTMLPQNLSEARGIAQMIAQSGLFGAKTEAEAFALMLLADAEGLHPAIAARDYHIIEGKPSMRADAMLARFQSAGGRVRWVKLSDTEVTAVFSHEAGGEAEITWTMTMASKITTKGKPLTQKDNWRNYPRQMLKARVISEGVRTVFPGIAAGIYTPEEVQDFDAPRQPVRQKAAAAPPAEEVITTDGEVIQAEVVESDPEPQPGTKADSRDLYATLQKGLRNCKSSHELRQWGTAFADDIKKLPKDWATGLREDYRAEMNAFLDHEEKEQLKDAYDAV